MIQRIQSIYFLLAIIITIVVVFIPIGYLQFDNNNYTFTTFMLKESTGEGYLMQTIYLALMLFASAILSIITLFSYKNRKKQISFNTYNLTLFLLILVLALYVFPDLIFKRQGWVEDANSFQFNYWIMISILPPFFIYLANRAIRKDEKLVQQSDRLR